MRDTWIFLLWAEGKIRVNPGKMIPNLSFDIPLFRELSALFLVARKNGATTALNATVEPSVNEVRKI